MEMEIGVLCLWLVAISIFGAIGMVMLTAALSRIKDHALVVTKTFLATRNTLAASPLRRLLVIVPPPRDTLTPLAPLRAGGRGISRDNRRAAARAVCLARAD
jgi:hypothetical protein